MGTSTDGHCYACGYNFDVMIGGGMQNFETFASWPVLCSTCGDVSTTNLKADPQTCLACGSEDIAFFKEVSGGRADVFEWEKLRASNRDRSRSPRFKMLSQDADDQLAQISTMLGTEDDDASTVAENSLAVGWEDRRLSKGRYACPSCRKAELRFGTEFASSPIMWD